MPRIELKDLDVEVVQRERVTVTITFDVYLEFKAGIPDAIEFDHMDVGRKAKEYIEEKYDFIHFKAEVR